MLDGNELRALIRDVIATEIAAVKREHAPGTPAPAQSPSQSPAPAPKKSS